MKISAQPGNSTRAFTKLELVVVVLVLLVIVSVMIPASNNKEKARRIKCVSNLKIIGLSFYSFASDHNDLFPMRISTNEGGTLEYAGSEETFRHFLVLSNELSVGYMLRCPSDDSERTSATFFPELESNQNISYFVGLDANSQNSSMLLVGDRFLKFEERQLTGIVNLGTNQNIAWNNEFHKHGGNVALSDSSVRSLSNSELRVRLLETGDLTNRVSIPD